MKEGKPKQTRRQRGKKKSEVIRKISLLDAVWWMVAAAPCRILVREKSQQKTVFEV